MNDLLFNIVCNLSCGCISSVLIAWLIECFNVRNKNIETRMIANYVYSDLKHRLVDYFEMWASICNKYFSNLIAKNKKNTWYEWLIIFETNYQTVENDQLKEKILSTILDNLSSIIKDMELEIEELRKQKNLLFISNIIDIDELVNILELYLELLYLHDYISLTAFDIGDYFDDLKSVKEYISNINSFSYLNDIRFEPKDFYKEEEHFTTKNYFKTKFRL